MKGNYYSGDAHALQCCRSPFDRGLRSKLSINLVTSWTT